jgi:hypothetical protein
LVTLAFQHLKFVPIVAASRTDSGAAAIEIELCGALVGVGPSVEPALSGRGASAAEGDSTSCRQRGSEC